MNYEIVYKDIIMKDIIEILLRVLLSGLADFLHLTNSDSPVRQLRVQDVA